MQCTYHHKSEIFYKINSVDELIPTHSNKQKKNHVPFGLFPIKFSRIIQLVLELTYCYLWPIALTTLDLS